MYSDTDAEWRDAKGDVPKGAKWRRADPVGTRVSVWDGAKKSWYSGEVLRLKKRGGQVRYRSLTAREAARLQSFPDDFEFVPDGGRGSVYLQIGNAVPCKLAEAVARSIAKR